MSQSQDYNKGGYVGNTQGQTKGAGANASSTGTTGNDLSAMYGKSHTAIGKVNVSTLSFSIIDIFLFTLLVLTVVQIPYLSFFSINFVTAVNKININDDTDDETEVLASPLYEPAELYESFFRQNCELASLVAKFS